MKVGIIGLPQSGKTTILDAITGAEREVGAFSGPGHFDLVILKVVDERLHFLRDLFGAKKCTEATVEFMDVAGAFKAPSDPDAEPSAAIAALREAEALMVVLRAFANDSVPHPYGEIDAARDLERIGSELILTDLISVEKRLQKLSKQTRRPGPQQKEDQAEMAVLERFKEALDAETPLSSLELSEEEERRVRNLGFLTLKPQLVMVNVGEEDDGAADWAEKLGRPPEGVMSMCGELEMELRALDESERGDFMKEMGLEKLSGSEVVKRAYRLLGLISFLTANQNEVRAWTVTDGDTAVVAAGKVHTDMARGFIRAEVVAFDDLKEFGSMKDARAHGKVRLEGKDYVVRDGDVIEFRFNV